MRYTLHHSRTAVLSLALSAVTALAHAQTDPLPPLAPPLATPQGAQTASALPRAGGKPVYEGITLFERVSRNELNRLSITNGRIGRMHFKTDELDVTKDDALGQAFFTPRVDKTISVFITTTSGLTFTLVLQPVPSMPAVNIALTEQRAAQGQIPQEGAASPGAARAPALLTQMSYEQAITTLIFGAATGQEIPGVSEEKLGVSLKLWQGTTFDHLRNLRTSGLRLEEYRLTNIGKTTIRVAEPELYKPGVLAVAIEQHVLEPGEATPVFVVLGDQR
jgi:conjugal transfer pilus assembly protein TraK